MGLFDFIFGDSGNSGKTIHSVGLDGSSGISGKMPGTVVNPDGFSGTSGKIPDEKPSIIDTIGDFLFGDGESNNSAYGYTSHRRSTAPVVYYDAPYAEKYGMSAATAYQEALANTAYQRKVKDLQAAGLNPVLGISGSGADGVYGASTASSGTSYGSIGSGKSISSSAKNATKLSYWLPTFLNGAVNGVVSLASGNSMTGFAAGMVAQNISSGILGAIRNS